MATKTFEELTSEDIIDVRDLIERFEELETIKETALDEASEDGYSWQWGKDEEEELKAIDSLLEELKGSGGDEKWKGDWYPINLINEDYFETHIDETMEDCYKLPKDLPFWMKITYDYDALKMDYTTIEINDNTYYYR